jgi:hypothetical protein
MRVDRIRNNKASERRVRSLRGLLMAKIPDRRDLWLADTKESSHSSSTVSNSLDKGSVENNRGVRARE